MSLENKFYKLSAEESLAEWASDRLQADGGVNLTRLGESVRVSVGVIDGVGSVQIATHIDDKNINSKADWERETTQAIEHSVFQLFDMIVYRAYQYSEMEKSFWMRLLFLFGRL